MNEKSTIDGHPHRSGYGEMMKLVLFLVIDIPVILLVIGMVWLYLMSLVVLTITERLQSLANTR